MLILHSIETVTMQKLIIRLGINYQFSRRLTNSTTQLWNCLSNEDVKQDYFISLTKILFNK